MDDDLSGMLHAHVRFELARWQGDALPGTVATEVDALFDWLDAAPLRTLATPEQVRDWIRRVVVEMPVTDELLAEIDWALRAAHEALLEATMPLADVLPQERYDEIVTGVVGQQRIRREVVSQVTASTVYAKLISHVLYQGLKNYVLTENAVVRKVPGASSLLRMGQNAVRSASPGLEAGIDRRLVAFVASNVSETIQDSQEFLESVLDDTMLRTVAAEIWATNGPRPVGESAALFDETALGELVATGRDVWTAIRSSPVTVRVIDGIVDQFYRAHGDEPAAVLLADLGLTRELAAASLVEVVGPAIEAAQEGGALEAYVRSRLAAFYESYSA